MSGQECRSNEWAAGVFEGEGTIVIRRREYGGKTLQLSVYSTDQDVLTHFCAVVGIGSVKGPYRRKNLNLKRPPKKSKAMYQWYAYGREGQQLLIRFLPYLCERRKKKAREALQLEC